MQTKLRKIIFFRFFVTQDDSYSAARCHIYSAGYIQRGGAPTPFDRNLATRMGGYATEMIATGQFGRMVALKGDKITSIPLEEVAGKLKLVNEDHDLIIQGKRMGVCFG